MKLRSLLALPLALSLVSCADKQPVISTPPAERFAPVAEPAIPAGDTDAEVADYLTRLITALREANGKLLWLGDWRTGVSD